jgi:CHAT domain-containing protein
VKYDAGFSLATLQGSDLSLSQIGSYFNIAHNLVASDASRRNFQQQFSDYQVVQLYTHAAESSSHDEPVIYFADSALYLSDLIPEKKPQTRLIVLSACETGNGKFYQGEGVFSFNRGFAAIGIPSSITNLWSVDNKTTYRITELFYKYLSKGLPIDLALQNAKLDFIQHASKENKLPYYWAACILAGKSDAITNEKEFPWKDIVIVTGLTSLTFFVWQKRKKLTTRQKA